MTLGIRLDGCTNVTFTNVAIENVDTAFDISDSNEIQMTNVHCQSTGEAVVGERVSGLQAVSFTHHQSAWLPQPTPLAMIIRRAAYGYV